MRAKMLKFFRELNYRHYICIAITLGFIACAVFVFPAAFGRLIESGRDFGLSMAFYFCELFEIPYKFTPTVNSLPQVFDWLPQTSPITPLPETWAEFVEKWGMYWQLWATKENVLGYLVAVGNGARIFSMLLLPLMSLVFLLRIAIARYLKTYNNDYAVETRPLRAFKRISDYTYRPVKLWIIGFVTFLKEHKKYLYVWAFIWAFNFNFITIIIEFLAYYFYFAMSFDFVNIYIQVYKLTLDLWTVISFVPLWAWMMIGFYVLHMISLSIGYKKLQHRERCNRGFLNERSYINTIYAYIGAGKTALATDMALSDEVQLLSDAYEIMLEIDMHFPYFNWIILENEVKRACYFHVIYDKWSCRRWVRKKYRRWMKEQTRDRIFGYDFERYGLTYDDNLKVEDIWQAIMDYAQAYMIYTVQSSYIIANYSIRSDKLMEDMGNFPLWNTDFFKRDSKLIDSFSRHSHILDFDMLRLGKIMLANNPNRYAFGFGVYVVTEVDKERKNSPTLKSAGVSAKSEVCNQENDLFNACLTMSRHACIIRNRVFIRIICDLQRTGSLNAGQLELGDTIEIYNSEEMSPVLPFYSPYWLIELFCHILLGKFSGFYEQYRFIRSDNTLLMYILKGIVSKFANYRERMCNLFGSQVVKLRVERGLNRGNGEVKERKWYRQSKKIYSKRFATDCVSSMFEVRGEFNRIGINDLKEYAGIMATNDERELQHSFFENDVRKYAA